MQIDDMEISRQIRHHDLFETDAALNEEPLILARIPSEPHVINIASDVAYCQYSGLMLPS